ncbi:MAG: hypothetical protein KKD07_01035 [Candidatus Omnitrophica bacterium]|nr:hypothetical protein [Candidatus Omnitrophota bacterium]MBU1996293.1 hypothetical protein [Candidatus Omnitrophota bacterium]MBU4333007.1 hypothetical protein [Candidatus Omnitrophota bacterium]
MKSYLAGLFIVFFVATSFAQDNQVQLKDGQIIIKTPEEVKALDYSAEEKYSAIKLKKWDIRKESDVVGEALKVYKKKQDPVYSQKIWISEKEDGTQKILVEYKSSQEDSRIIFSPDEDYMYYIGLSDTGESMIYGMKLSGQESFVFDAADDFQLMECPGSGNYFVLLKNNEDPRVMVYDSEGDQEDVLHYTGDLMDLDELICN